MKKHFYHHLIEIDSIHIALDNLKLTPEEKKELIVIVDTNIHHLIIDTVLSELEENDKKTFLTLIVTENHDEIWKLLSGKITNVEKKIKATVGSLVERMLEDIREAYLKKLK